MRSDKKKTTQKYIVSAVCAVFFIMAIWALVKFYPDTKTVGEQKIDEASIVINEICSSSQSSVYDEDGDYPDFIELYNPTQQPWDITGWKITDNNNDSKYVFGNVTIAPGEYLLVFASGKNTSENGVIHLNFKLSEGEIITLFGSGNVIVDRVEVPYMDDNVSYGRNGISDMENWVFFPSPTPGHENFTKSFSTNDESVGKIGSPVYVSEVMPSPYEGEDWIELANNTPNDISLAGYSLSDSFKTSKYSFGENIVIPAGGYLLIYADGGGYVDNNGTIHTNFKLDRYNEAVVLYYGDFVLDSVSYGYMNAGVSAGRKNGDDAARSYFTYVTPLYANSEEAYSGYSPKVMFSVAAGCYESPVDLTLYTIEKDAVIYYTADGSTPNASSNLYTEPLHISGNTPIRAVSYKEGKITSDAVTSNYVIGAKHTLPVVFITTAPENMFGYDGIYKSQLYDREKIVANLSLIETDGSEGFNIAAYLSIHGNMTVFEDKKSFSVGLSETIGNASLKYKLFPDDATRNSEFSSFLLRSGGNDWNATQIKDGMLATLASTKMDLDYQGFRPCIVYINGEYWGLYNIREKENDNYLHDYYGVDKDNVDIISFGYGVHKGSYDNYDELLDFIHSDLDTDENWEKLNSMMDIGNMIDTYLCHIYYGNFDTVNIKWWRENTEGARWRWFLYDLDYALYVPADNELAMLTNPAGHGVGQYFSSELLYNLMKSDRFREIFLQKIASYWDNIFYADNILNHWYSIFYKIAPELKRNLDSWDISKSYWLSEMNECYDFIVRRPAYFKRFVKNYFGLSQDEVDSLLPDQEITVGELDWWEEITTKVGK